MGLCATRSQGKRIAARLLAHQHHSWSCAHGTWRKRGYTFKTLGHPSPSATLWDRMKHRAHNNPPIVFALGVAAALALMAAFSNQVSKLATGVRAIIAP